MVLNSPFTKTLYIDFPLLPLWRSLSELSEMLPPRLQSSFCPKQNLIHTLKFYIFFSQQLENRKGFPVVENLAANAEDIRDVGLIPGLGRSREGGHGNPLQYSYLENTMDRGAWWATAYGITKSWTRVID